MSSLSNLTNNIWMNFCISLKVNSEESFGDYLQVDIGTYYDFF